MNRFRLLRTLGLFTLVVLFVASGAYAEGPLPPGSARAEGKAEQELLAADTSQVRAPSAQAWVIETPDSLGNVGEYTSLALDATGWPHIAYSDSGSGDLKYARFDGAAWLTETVDSAGIVGLFTSLVLDAGGRPHIAYFDWSNRALKYARWDGVAWQFQMVDSGLGLGGGYASLALDTAGWPHIAYYNGASADLKYARWDGTAWQIQTVESAGAIGEYASLALDGADQPHISYYDGGNGALKVARWDGAVWQIQTVDGAGDVGLWTSLALDGSDWPHISYYDSTLASLRYAYWDGSAWQIQTVEGGGVGEYTSLALDSAGRARITYHDSANGDLKYARWDGSVWQIEPVDGAGDSGLWTSLALDAGSCPHVSYYDAAAADLKYAYLCVGLDQVTIAGPASVPTGQTALYTASYLPITASLPLTFVWDNGTTGPAAAYSWTTPGVYTLTVTATNACGQATGRFTVTVCQADVFQWLVETVDTIGKVGEYTSLALDTADLPHISYFDETNYDLKYAWHDGMAWHTQTVDSTGDVGLYTSLALDPAGRPHISYYASWPGFDLKYAWYDGTIWRRETVDSAGAVGEYTSLVLNPAGWPAISYYDRTNRDLKYAWWDGTLWHPEVVDTTGDVGRFTSLALDEAGRPHVSYLDSSNGALKYAWYDGSVWNSTTVVGGIGETAGSNTSLALDLAGYPHISYYDASAGRLGSAHYDGVGWQIESLDVTGDAGQYASLALGADDRTHVSYYLSWPPHDLDYAHYTSCAWQIEVIDSLGDVGWYTSLALNPLNYPRISFFDNSNGDLKYAFVCVPVEEVTIAGPTLVVVGDPAVYTATYAPPTATMVFVTWDSGAVGPTATYSWTAPGMYTMTVTATSPCGVVSQTFTVEVCQPVEGVAVEGPPFLLTRETAVYTASYIPPTATLPVTLTWDNGTISDTATYSWTMPGFYTLTVTATNQCTALAGTYAVEVCQPIDDIAVAGPTVLPIGGTGRYTATALPLTTTLPVTFSWDNGTISPTTTYSWTVPGAYSITVTGTSACGEVSVTVAIVVCQSMDGVEISGPDTLRTGQPGTFAASPLPPTATLPITFTWDNGMVGPSAVYSWGEPGTYSVVTTATNACSQVSANFPVWVCQAVEVAAVSGPALLPVGETGIYYATYSPLDASPPFTYTWNSGMTGPVASYSWPAPGNYTVAVTIRNPCGQVVGSLAVRVRSLRIYLPFVVKGL